VHFSLDCQQKAGPSAWTPFHESASAVTQLYKGNVPCIISNVHIQFLFLDALEVCRAGMEAGIQHGQKKRNREMIAWAKKKRKVIKRDELLAFLSDRPYRETSPIYSNLPDTTPHLFGTADLAHNSSTFGRTQGNGLQTTCSFVSTNCTSPYHSTTMLSPRRNRGFLRDDSMSLADTDISTRDSNSRKRQISLSYEYSMDQPLSKRGRL